MRPRTAALIALVLAAGGSAWFLVGRALRPAPGGLNLITPMNASKVLAAGEAVLIDVREEPELSEGLAAPARWMPSSEINEQGSAWEDFVSSIPRGSRVILYCESGGRAMAAGEKLAERGFQTYFFGGFGDWVREGLPVRKLDWNGDGSPDAAPPSEP